MATMEQIKSLIRSHVSDQQEQFRVTALQVAAHEAALGHSAIAHEIRNLIDSKPPVRRPQVVPYTPDFENLVNRVDETIYRNAIVLNEGVRDAIVSLETPSTDIDLLAPVVRQIEARARIPVATGMRTS